LDAKLQGDFALSKFEKSILDNLTEGGRRPASWERVRIGKILEAAEL